MATTPNGLPYPLVTDPVNQGAGAIQALATALDPSFGRSKRSVGSTNFSTSMSLPNAALTNMTQPWSGGKTFSDFGGTEFGTNGAYTCPVDGFYSLSMLFNCSAQLSGRSMMQIANGAVLLAIQDLFTGGVARMTVAASSIFLAKNSVIQWAAMQNSGAAQTVILGANVRLLHEGSVQ